MRSYAAFWLYTLARFALFFGLWAVQWVAGVPVVLAGIIAAVVSVPLSLVLLGKPRRAFAASLEDRIERRRTRARELDAQLAGQATAEPPPTETHPTEPDPSVDRT